MMEVVFLFHKKAEMSDEDFQARWLENGQLGAKIPGLRKYVQNPIIATPDGSTPAYDGMSEIRFTAKSRSSKRPTV